MSILTVMIIAKIWGGTFYLLNKIFFLFSEKTISEEKNRQWSIWAWSIYLVGLPGWLTYFFLKDNWAAFGVETGGSVLMAIGLIYAIKKIKEDPSKKYLWIARVATGAGIIASLFILKGLSRPTTQFLEFFICIGFLGGTYLLRKKNVKGYLWFMLMNASNAGLTGIQGDYWLTLQQIVSLLIVIGAYRIKKRREESKNLAKARKEKNHV